jgi:cytochrome c oxidase subunit 3/cytochrome o ubiquinol oxidase subunit 3
MSQTQPATAAAAEWKLPARDNVGMICLIIAEAFMFLIFVVAYIYNLGKSTYGPTPREALSVPIVGTVCLLSSSIFIGLAVRALGRGRMRAFAALWGITAALGAIFLIGTAIEWTRLVREEGLTPSTNLFGTTYYSLVGLHALHVTIGLVALTTVLILTLRGSVRERHHEPIEALSLYWHFVDGIWVVVFSVVYLIGR